MTTLPIEVIVQDAEAPIVPGEDGTNNTETNIAVPDTGTISSSGDTSSSASSIILPAILLVLAIGSIVAIFIYKHNKQKNNKAKNETKVTKKEKLAVATSSTIAVLAITVLIGNLVIPATKAATSDIEDGITPAEDKVSIVVTRDGSSAEASIESTATITSTSDFGYTVLLSMAEGVGTSNLYLDGDEASKYYIASTESTELTDNTWGYALAEDGEYAAIPLLDDAIAVAQGDGAVEDEALSIYYGVKVSSDLPAGTYSGGEIEYLLEEYNGFPVSLTTMQGMTSEICDATYTPNAFKADGVTIEDNVPTKTLTDTRDGKTYTVAKLADGKCWMTQNLDLQKEGLTMALNSDNTDHPANGFTLLASQTDGNESWYNQFDKESSINTPHVYDLSAGGETYKYCMRDRYGNCEEYGDDIPATKLGNLYNWYAATAGTGTYDTGGEGSEDTTGSICPANWRLPNNSSSRMATDYSTLLARYGIIESPTSPAYAIDNHTAYYEAPLSFVPAGYYNGTTSNAGLKEISVLVTLQSSLAASNHDTYFLQLSPSEVQPWKYEWSKWYGFAVRCVAR